MESRYSVLVDTSVWISWFKSANHPELDQLIEEDLVCTNDIVLTELIPVLKKQKQFDVIESLLSFPKIDIPIDWEIIRQYQYTNLINGINSVGIPDLMILFHIIDQRITLFSEDNHFRLLQEVFHFDLLKPTI